MRVEVLVGLRPTVVEGATRVVVYGDNGEPIDALVEWLPGVVSFGNVEDGAKFTQLLAGLGVDRTTVVGTLRPVTY